MRLENRVAIVTGGGSGIGAASARLFAREGARVAIVDRDAAGANAVAAEIGDAALAFTADVTDAAAAERITADILSRWGRIDVLMTSAGISTGGTVLTIDEATWDQVFAVNVKGTWLWVRAVLPHMIAAGRGSVITVGSQLAVASLGGNAAYIASKGAIASLTKTMAVDHAATGVRFNALMPGAIDTPMVARSMRRAEDPAERRRRLEARHALGRLGRPEEMAGAALFLASDEASFCTGHLLLADGGWTAA